MLCSLQFDPVVIAFQFVAFCRSQAGSAGAALSALFFFM